MRKTLMTAVFAVCFIAVGLSGQDQGGQDSKASFKQFVEASNKASTSNDAKWMEANLADDYVEGTSFGTWIPKAQLIKKKSVLFHSTTRDGYLKSTDKGLQFLTFG